MLAVLVLVATLFGSVASAEPVHSIQSTRCLSCHGMPNLVVRDSTGRALHDFSVPQAFASSVHGRLACEQCHGDVGTYPHNVRANKVTCAQECHARDREGRVYSHAETVAEFESSIHRPRLDRDPRDRPTCLNCHGSGDPHAIGSVKELLPSARIAQCAGCHDDPVRMARNDVEPDAVRSYKRSFHYKAIRFGGTKTAVCQDCHTAHRIRPASDASSSVARTALPATCGQTRCHVGAGARFAVSGANHLDLRIKREPVLRAEEWLFRLLTAATMAMLLIGIVLDVQKRFGWIALVRRAARAVRPWLAAFPTMTRRSIRFARWLLAE